MLFAVCCGAIAANLYYAQPIIGLIAQSVGLTTAEAGLVVSLTQIGYALGLLLLVPLADLVENRRLMIVTVLISAVSLALAAVSQQPGPFLLLSLMIGLSSVSVQMLIPLAAYLAPAASRGKVVGNIMAGLLLGILLARPIASLVADHYGWRTVYIAAAVLMLAIMLVMILTLPRHKPDHRASYAQLLKSLAGLLATYPVLRRRALYQALMFAGFSLFWTAVPLELSLHLGLSQTAIGIFALVGAIGALSAPLAGRLADAGHTRKATAMAMLIALVAFLVGVTEPGYSLAGLAITGILVDFSVQMNMVLGQREIYGLEPKSGARLNALYMTSIFIGGAAGSALAGALYTAAGWPAIALLGAGISAAALIAFLFHSRR
nr:MFS transporter [Marinobacterium sedimentorum]